MGQAAGGCSSQEALGDELVTGQWCSRGACCEEAGDSSGSTFFGQKQLMSGTGGTDENVPTDEADSNPRGGGLSGMMSPSTAAGTPMSTTSSEWPASISEYRLTLSNVLDIFSICSRSLGVLRVALQALDPPQGDALDAGAVRAVAEAAVGSDSNQVEEVLPLVRENLQHVFHSGSMTSDMVELLRVVIEKSANWKFDGSGRIDVAPRLVEEHLLEQRFSQGFLADVRRLACAHVPPAKHGFDLVRGFRETQFDSSRISQKPHVIITVGPPGAGKTYILLNRCVGFLHDELSTPPMEDYVRLDPDYYISNLLDNNNDYREMANFCNHESLMCAIGQRRHVLFDHTGKDLANTCGRVISRFKEAGYMVHFCIVLSTYSMCRTRTQERLESTGRSVSDAYTKSVFEALEKTIPWYLENRKMIADTTIVYSNLLGCKPVAKIIETDDDAQQAAEFAKARLALQRPSKMAPKSLESSAS